MPDQQDEIRQVYEGLRQLNESNQRNLDRFQSLSTSGQLGNADYANWKMYQREFNQNQKAIDSLVEDNPWLTEADQPATPEGPTFKQKAIAAGSKAAQGAMEMPYHMATSPVTLPATLEQISPLHQGAAALRDYFLGKPTESTLQQGAELVQQGGEQLFGEGGYLPIRPYAEQKREEAL